MLIAIDKLLSVHVHSLLFEYVYKAKESRKRALNNNRKRFTKMADNRLRTRLTTLRSNLMEKLDCPEQDIYTDEAVEALIRLRPLSLDKLLKIRGIREAKWAYYADTLLKVIQETDDEMGGIYHQPIDSLTIDQRFWVIKARVTQKTEINSWPNSRGKKDVKYFKLRLRETSSLYDICATFFDKSVEKFDNLIKEDQVYSFSGGKLKYVSPKGYNNCKSPLEIIFDDKTLVDTNIVCGERVRRKRRQMYV